MQVSEFGCKDGLPVCYFHGVPGGPDEVHFFEPYALKYGLSIICVDRYSMAGGMSYDQYFKGLATAVREKVDAQNVVFVGFSLGCHSALELAAMLQDQVRQIHLVSAVAPLSSGNYLPLMAGKLIFHLAKNYPLLFRVFSQTQSLLAKTFPGILTNGIFSSAQGLDRDLYNQVDFQRFAEGIVRETYGGNIDGFCRDVIMYTRWEGQFSCVESDTFLWHGSYDNWSPISMALYLSQSITPIRSWETFNRASHYSCLLAAAPKICRIIAGD